MRRLVLGILLTGFAVSACDKAPTTTTNLTTGDGASDKTAATAGDAVDRDTPRKPNILEKAVAKTIGREVTIPAGTELPIVLDTTIGSDTSSIETPVRAHLSRAVSLDGEAVLAEGSSVTGVVTDAKRSGKVKGLAHVAVRFDTIVPAGDNDRYRIQTAAVGRTAAATKKEDAIKIGAPAAGGAIIGAIVGGGKGAAIGTAVGGGAGTGVVMSTRGKEIRLPVGSALRIKLTEPLTIRLRG
jgi:hypothetical protein